MLGVCVPLPDLLFLIGSLVPVVNNLSIVAVIEIINPKFVMGLCLHTAANHICQSCSVKHGEGIELVIKQEVDFRLPQTPLNDAVKLKSLIIIEP